MIKTKDVSLFLYNIIYIPLSVYSHTISPDSENANALGPKHKNRIKTAVKRHQNAYSYRVFAAICTRSQYKPHWKMAQYVFILPAVEYL